MKKEKIHASSDNVTTDVPNQANDKKSKNRKNIKSWLLNSYNPKLLKFSEWLGAALLIAAITTYVSLGYLMHNWSKTWMIFIFVPVIPSILACIAKRNFNSFGIAFLITGIYCAIGMNLGIWHPTWTMFFGIILYHSIATWLDKKIMVKYIEKKIKDTQEKTIKD